MSLIRNIIIWGENEGLNDLLFSGLTESSNKFKIDIISNRSAFSQILAEKRISIIILNSSIKSDIQYALRLCKMYQTKTNNDLVVFFSSEDFEIFQDTISSIDLENFNVLTSPINPIELTSQIYNIVFNKNIPKNVISKNNKLNIDLEFIEVFIKATKNVLTEMGSVETIVHSKPLFLSSMKEQIGDGISSKILISSDFFKGSFYVLFPKKSFLKLYENAVFETCENINEDNQDFASELANIIYGQSKKVFTAQGLTLDMAIPSLQLSCKINSELVVIIPFKSSIGEFYIGVAPGDL